MARPVINQSHLTGRQEPEVIHPPCFILLRFTFASSRETLTQKSTCQEDKHGPSADLLIPRNPLFYYISYFDSNFQMNETLITWCKRENVIEI